MPSKNYRKHNKKYYWGRGRDRGEKDGKGGKDDSLFGPKHGSLPGKEMQRSVSQRELQRLRKYNLFGNEQNSYSTKIKSAG